MKIKALEFYKVSERLPSEACTCLLLYRNEESLSSDQFVGTMPWVVEGQYWLDIFGTPEAGMIWHPTNKDVQKYGMWAKWEEEE